eukprot:TRINITY_DN5004_c0_g1_i1.p1 TRINITY_DN5004_c0_g1~~TRINITY_DN5004_c0_g1_i1.p1  ORF type:complete len:611 (-),score=215.35 TRINITY_DN5004_c0_g1_i1:63-1895(-)
MGNKNKGDHSSPHHKESNNKRQKSLKEEHQREISHNQNSKNGKSKKQREKSNANEKSNRSVTVKEGEHILIHLNESGQKAPKIDIDSDDSSLLESLLWPVSPSHFFQNVWKKRAYASLLKDENRARMEDLIRDHLHDLNLEKLLKTTASESIFVWMRPLESILGKVMEGTKEKIESFELQGENAISSAKTCYASGASLYFRSSQDLADILVARLTDELGIGFAGYYPNGDVKGEIEVFMSRKGHVTDWHFDFMENFTFQLKGKKTWKMRKSTINHPLRGATSHYKNVDTSEQQLKVHHLKDPNFTLRPKDDDEYETVTLTEGSFFYHPAGIWHRVECEEDSISINVSLIASTWADMVTEGLRHSLWTQDEWREGINFRNPTEAKQKLEKLLSNLSTQVGQFKAVDFLPDGLFQANGQKDEEAIEVSDVEIRESPLADVKMDDLGKVTFRRNPIAVLIPLEGLEENEEEGEEGSEDDDAKTWEELGSDSDEGSSGGEGREEDENGNEDKDEHPLSLYALHINFGNEELASAVEVRLAVYSELDGAIDWLRVQKNQFTMKQLFDVAKKEVSKRGGKLTEEEIIKHLLKLMGILLFHGFANRQNNGKDQTKSK